MWRVWRGRGMVHQRPTHMHLSRHDRRVRRIGPVVTIAGPGHGCGEAVKCRRPGGPMRRQRCAKRDEMDLTRECDGGRVAPEDDRREGAGHGQGHGHRHRLGGGAEGRSLNSSDVVPIQCDGWRLEAHLIGPLAPQPHRYSPEEAVSHAAEQTTQRINHFGVTIASPALHHAVERHISAKNRGRRGRHRQGQRKGQGSRAHGDVRQGQGNLPRSLAHVDAVQCHVHGLARHEMAVVQICAHQVRRGGLGRAGQADLLGGSGGVIPPRGVVQDEALILAGAAEARSDVVAAVC
mmetsp:Transcript_21906/g.53708  ORF Transcript_21906/g.53708 Transcript_21906/m.53708 type:complete len:292 (-) Transcript_21906:126-1001(-)